MHHLTNFWRRTATGKFDAEYARYIDYVGTVSYTHLRAHETVLDLVCRLLLETKKNTHYDSIYCVIHKQQRT